MHSFCVSAHFDIGSRDVETSFIDFDIEITEIVDKTIEKVLKPAHIKYLLLFSNSLSITYFVKSNNSNIIDSYVIKLPFENIYNYLIGNSN